MKIGALRWSFHQTVIDLFRHFVILINSTAVEFYLQGGGGGIVSTDERLLD
jgi:hypothetical protein